MPTAKPKARKRREAFGKVRRLPSGRYQASHLGPSGERHNAPMTFDTLTDARGWLARQRADLDAGTWGERRLEQAAAAERAAAAVLTVGDYADRWIRERTSANGAPLRERTEAEYRRLLRTSLADLAALPLGALTTARVRTWQHALASAGTLTTAARAYGLLRSIYATAVLDGLVASNPVTIKGAQRASTGRKVEPPTDAELAAIVAAMPERYRAGVLIAAWGGLRFGELTELRRGDVSLLALADGREVYVVQVVRAVTRVGERFVIGKPKSAAGVRRVTLPPHLTEAVRLHLREHVGRTADALLLPARGGGHLNQSSLAKVWYPARAAVGRADLPWHGLRHFGATRFAQVPGVTTRELQERLGHSTIVAAMRYQHTAGRDAELAALMPMGSTS